MIHLLVTSGRGPAECRLAVARVVAAIAARLGVGRLIAGWGRMGERLVFWVATVVERLDAVGVSDTVPGSLAVGDRAQVHLAEEGGRLVLPFWCALARLPRRAREAGDPQLAGDPAPHSMTSAGDQESWTDAGQGGRSA